MDPPEEIWNEVYLLTVVGLDCVADERYAVVGEDGGVYDLREEYPVV